MIKICKVFRSDEAKIVVYFQNYIKLKSSQDSEEYWLSFTVNRIGGSIILCGCISSAGRVKLLWRQILKINRCEVGKKWKQNGYKSSVFKRCSNEKIHSLNFSRNPNCSFSYYQTQPSCIVCIHNKLAAYKTGWRNTGWNVPKKIPS